MDLLTNRFVLGLIFGLIIGGIVAFNLWKGGRALKKENGSLREHLHTQMTINARGNKDVSDEIARLKSQNENLRISLATLQNKPDRSELRTLYVYDKAIHRMYQKVPGFAAAWELTVEEAEAEMQQIDSGMMAWLRKAIRPAPAVKVRAAENGSGQSSPDGGEDS